jgi:bla regulator protein BlaR1
MNGPYCLDCRYSVYISCIDIGTLMKLRLTFASVALLWTSLLPAQSTFEVASVKPNVSANGPADPQVSPGRFSWFNVTLRLLIQVAYDVRPYQLIGLPDWANTARFDVAATTSFAASPQQTKGMLQRLLVDRFDLAVHHDRRELAVYTLVLAHRDGRLGPNIHPSALDCESIAARPLDSGTAQTSYDACAPQMGLTRLKATGFRMSGLASALMRIFDRAVVNQTGLPGTFDAELTWTPDPMMMPNGVLLPPNVTSGAPSIFTALEEQLGLRVVSGRGAIDVLVINRLSRLKPD